MSNQIPPAARKLVESGYGYTVEHDDGDIKTGFHFLSFREMEEMGEAERVRLGVERIYQFALKKHAELGKSPASNDEEPGG